MADSTHREVTLRDARTLAFIELGSPSGRPIVYCHGTPSSRVEGNLIVNGAMASAFGLRLIVPDRPGWGTEPNEEAIRARPPKGAGGLVQPRGLGPLRA